MALRSARELKRMLKERKGRNMSIYELCSRLRDPEPARAEIKNRMEPVRPAGRGFLRRLAAFFGGLVRRFSK